MKRLAPEVTAATRLARRRFRGGSFVKTSRFGALYAAAKLIPLPRWRQSWRRGHACISNTDCR